MNLYSTKTCAYCHQLKDFLTKRNVDFKVVDITDDIDTRRELQEKYGATTVPVLVKGDMFTVGMNMQKIMQMI